MTTLEVDYQETTSEISLRGPSQDLRSAPLFSAFLRSCSATISSDRYIVIPCSLDDLQSKYSSLAKVIKRCGGRLTPAPVLSAAMAAFQREEAQFLDFATAASSIWEGTIVPTDFDNFVETVSSACPSRTFYRLQLLSAFHLAFSQNCCNFSVPGAGKTSIVLAAFAYLRALAQSNPKHVNHILVIGPLSCFQAWQDEFLATFSRHARATRISGITPQGQRHTYLRGLDRRQLATEITLYFIPVIRRECR